ncbi:MAG: MCP four helix bundle domain-containing protein [Anaerolineales bacterium]|nr:MCP four helix bundle domain-containing protein [Anaerolineales bacterium]
MDRILGNLSIGLKLGGSFFIIVLIMAASITFGYFDLNQLNQGMVSMYVDHTIPIQNLGEAKALLGQIKSNVQLYLQIPEPKPADSQSDLQCGVCHVSETTGEHHLKEGVEAANIDRCVACHSEQTKDPQHGRSTTDMTNVQDCAVCHPSNVIQKQHDQVEQNIKDEIARINEIISEYRSNPLLTSEEKTELAVFDAAWEKYQSIINDLLIKAGDGQSQDSLHRVVGGDALISQVEVESSINHLVVLNQDLANLSQQEGSRTFDSSSIRMLVTGILGVLISAWLGFMITRNIRTPVHAMASGLQNLRVGDLRWNISEQVKENLVQRSDEMGIAGEGFNSTVQYLQEMAGFASQIASGDLTVQVTPRSDADELGLAFSSMVENLQNLIRKMAQNADELTLASSSLAMASSQSGDAANQIAATTQQVTTGIIQQAEGVSKTAGSVEQLNRAIDGVARGAQEQAQAIGRASLVTSNISTAIEQVTQNAQAVTRDSANAASHTRDGARTVKETIMGMEVIRGKVALSSSKVKEMGARSEEIGTILETIQDIAGQTNLLALNAAIEAARAGEQGKGFAVVADEVRKLAERSSLATKEIAGLIQGIQRTVDEAVNAMKESADEVNAGVARANSAGIMLDDILASAESVYKQAEDAGLAAAKVSAAASELVESVDAVSAVIEENTAATEEMAANSSELTQSIENISRIGETNTASIEQVAAMTEDVSAQVEEVSASANSLMEMAKQLSHEIARFKFQK